MAPFNNLKARQAVNYAIDRRAMVNLFGGPSLATPVLPDPAGRVPRAQAATARTRRTPARRWSAPDVEKAKQLVQESGTAGQKVIVIVEDDAGRQGDRRLPAERAQRRSATTPSVKAISRNIHFTYIQNTNNKVQISVSQWYQDYPAASDFLYMLFGCDSFHPGSDSSINIAGFCDKEIDDQMHKALDAGRHQPGGGQQAVGEDRPDGHGPGADGDAVQSQAHRLRLQARRQLHLQRPVLLAGLAVLGPVGRARRAGALRATPADPCR